MTAGPTRKCRHDEMKQQSVFFFSYKKLSLAERSIFLATESWKGILSSLYHADHKAFVDVDWLPIYAADWTFGVAQSLVLLQLRYRPCLAWHGKKTTATTIRKKKDWHRNTRNINGRLQLRKNQSIPSDSLPIM